MRKNREERRRDSRRMMENLMGFCFLAMLLLLLMSYLSTTVRTIEETALEPQETDAGRLPGDDTPATERCYMTAEEVEAEENAMIEAALLARSEKIEGVTVTFYCSELYPHICGTGDGITASGRRVTPYVSCAVDPDVIPLGSTIMVDFGDGELVYLRADDVGGAISGDHIDIAVEGHDEAIGYGKKTATIYWCEEDTEFK